MSCIGVINATALLACTDGSLATALWFGKFLDFAETSTDKVKSSSIGHIYYKNSLMYQ